VVERRGEIGRGVGKRAVEVEGNYVEGEIGHARGARAISSWMKSSDSEIAAIRTQER
jgi:hypothetical protein